MEREKDKGNVNVALKEREGGRIRGNSLRELSLKLGLRKDMNSGGKRLESYSKRTEDEERANTQRKDSSRRAFL